MFDGCIKDVPCVLYCVMCERDLRIGALVGCRKQGPVERYPWKVKCVYYVICSLRLFWFKLLFSTVCGAGAPDWSEKAECYVVDLQVTWACLLFLPPLDVSILPPSSLSCMPSVRISSHSRPSHGPKYISRENNNIALSQSFPSPVTKVYLSSK